VLTIDQNQQQGNDNSFYLLMATFLKGNDKYHKCTENFWNSNDNSFESVLKLF
jgi:hypothetical protein